jgi:hypothetical protein
VQEQEEVTARARLHGGRQRRQHDAREIGRERSQHLRVLARARGGRRGRRVQPDAGELRERARQQQRQQRGEREVDGAIERCGAGVERRMARDQHAQHHQCPVPRDAPPLGGQAGKRRPARELGVEVADAVGEVVAAEAEPREVVERVAEVRELPVEQGGDAALRVQEVPGPDVAVTERDAVGGAWRVALQPCEGEARERCGALDARLEHAAPERELGPRRVGGRGPCEARQRQAGGVHPVQRGERVHVAVHHAGAGGGLEAVERLRPRRALDQQRVALGLRCQQPRDRHRAAGERPVDGSLARERQLGAGHRAVAGVRAQHALRAARERHEPGRSRRSRPDPRASRDARARRALDEAPQPLVQPPRATSSAGLLRSTGRA